MGPIPTIIENLKVILAKKKGEESSQVTVVAGINFTYLKIQLI